MKNIIIVFFLLLTLVGCGNKDYARFSPKEILHPSTFQEFSWSPDGARAAIYLDGKMSMITPDGEKIGNEISMNISDFKKRQWIKKNENWEYTFSTRTNTGGSGKEEKDSSVTFGKKPENERINFNNEKDFMSDVYEEVKLDENMSVFLGYTGKYFEVTRSNAIKREYVTIFKSNQILLGLNCLRGDIYFIGLNPKDISYRYTLYKFSGDKVQTIYLH